MEDQSVQPQTNVNPQVSFPSQTPPPAKKSNKVVPLILMVLAIVLIGAGVFFYLGRNPQDTSLSVTPEPQGIRVVDEYEPLPEPEQTPEPFERNEISVEVLNGTGIPKEASFLEAILNDLGYTDITAGNADKSDYTDTVVTFKSGSSDGLISEITEELEKVYKKVVSKTSSTQKSDVVIVTGLKTGATPKSSATPSPKPTVSPTPSPSPTPTPEN